MSSPGRAEAGPALRFAQAQDSPAIEALVEGAYRGEGSKAGWTTEADLFTGPRLAPGEIAAALADPDTRILLAESPGGGAPIACAMLARRSAETVYFGMFAVRPESQGGGLGALVLAEAERQARALWGARAIVMSVIDARATLIAWYERRGYRLTGARSPFPFAPEVGAVREDFAFVELRKDLDRGE